MTFEPGPEARRRLYAASVGVMVCATLGLVAVLALLVSGAGQAAPARAAAHGHGLAQQDPAPKQQNSPKKPATAMTVQQLAAAIGCTPLLAGKAADFRQASCTPDGTQQIVLVDFDTVEGQRTWLDLSQDYGGVYLVGERWALSGNSKKYMEELSGKLGGDVEEGDIH
ncbi:MAG: hypothetical protein GEV28_23895 [Actinophytocola sp.]|uniref:hypothetical protein n=1 Tax=Actinophytocola sp. TaxID=1872138 RepID=UPI001325249F|nr:hypothetical protein [Actinophytocola sp.]MPZ83268.1 hypothetical protein [Actinophytocola sp.]